MPRPEYMATSTRAMSVMTSTQSPAVTRSGAVGPFMSRQMTMKQQRT